MTTPASSSDFDAIFALERKTIRTPEGYPTNTDRPLTGLAFSGGGIRSATFNLGIVQALSDLRLLREFDYLSCVSGGGYIGGWLSAFIHRECNGKVELAEEKLRSGGMENAAIRFLRIHSNHLTPQGAFLSVDKLTAIATYLRNLYLNSLLLLLAFGSVLLLPRLLVWFVRWLTGWHNASPLDDRIWPLFVGGISCAVIAMLFTGMNLGYSAHRIPSMWYARQGWIVGLIVVPGLLSAWLISFGIYAGAQQLINVSVGAWMVWGVAIYVMPWVTGVILEQWLGRHGGQPFHQTRMIGQYSVMLGMGILGTMVGVMGGVLGMEFTQIAASIPRGSTGFGYTGSWIVSGLGTILLLTFYSLTLISYIGLTGRLISHDAREWYSRLGGWFLIVAAIWVTTFCLAYLPPSFLQWIDSNFTVFALLVTILWAGLFATAYINPAKFDANSLAGIITTLFGILQKPSNKAMEVWVALVASYIPYVIIIILLALLSVGVHQLLLVLPCSEVVQRLYGGQCQPQVVLRDSEFTNYLARESVYFSQVPIGLVSALCIGSVCTFFVLAWRIDVNLFSLYYFYRQRIVRCYLGASRSHTRVPHPFTGFDPVDDIKLATLYHEENAHIVCQRPYPIFNAAVNLVIGKQLAWQTRISAAFSFSPIASGYSIALPDEQGLRRSHYRPTAQYMEGVHLGSAMAISGAADSPNMGYHSSHALTWLMTAFNVRLGHWSGNPAHPREWASQHRRFSGIYFLKELFGFTGYSAPSVYLSDGGHFENLGIYELVRRSITTIVAIDVCPDKLRTFDDLGNVIRRCYADFGVVIDLNLDGLKHGYHAVGRILYPDQTEGTLIYSKPALIGTEPADLQNYGLTHPDFPHQPTTDQGFDESQFESYRKLGHWIGNQVFNPPMQHATAQFGPEVVEKGGALASISALMRERAGVPPESPSGAAREAAIENA